MYTGVPNSPIYNSQKVEMAQMSIGGCTDKPMVYTYMRILFSQKKEGMIHGIIWMNLQTLC